MSRTIFTVNKGYSFSGTINENGKTTPMNITVNGQGITQEEAFNIANSGSVVNNFTIDDKSIQKIIEINTILEN